MAPLVSGASKPILALSLVLLAIAGWGISRIVINDNPVKWLSPDHEIRVADEVLNSHFGGTYMAYLALDAPEASWSPDAFVASVSARLRDRKASL